MIAVILFFVVLAIAALIAGTLWERSLTTWKNALKEMEQDLNQRYGTYQTHLAQLQAREESLKKKQKEAAVAPAAIVHGEPSGDGVALIVGHIGNVCHIKFV